jgi:hypothetical protein
MLAEKFVPDSGQALRLAGDRFLTDQRKKKFL